MAGDPQTLSREEAIAFAKKQTQPRAMSRDEAIAFAKGVAPKGRPGGPYHGYNVLGAGLLEQLAKVPQELEILGSQMRPGSPLAVLGQLGGAAADPLMQTAERIDPAALRGSGGLAEDVLRTVGGMGGAAPAMALGPGFAAIQFGAMEGVPLYYEIKSKTGDETAALWGLLGGNFLGQLEKFGVEGLLGGSVERWAKGKVGQALVKTFMERALGVTARGAGEVLTEVGQQGGSDLLLEALTPEDVDNIERLKQALPTAAIVGTGIPVLYEAADAYRARQASQEVPGARQAQEVVPPTKEGELAQPQAEEPQGVSLPSERGVTDLRTLEEARGQAPGAAEVRPVDVPPKVDLGTAAPGLAPAGTVPELAPEAQVEPGAEGVPPPVPETAAGTVGIPLSERKEGAEQGLQPEAAPAPPAEPSKTIGIKNAAVEKELKEMGLPLPEKAERRGFVELHAEAKAKFEASKGEAGRDLVNDLEANPRAPSDAEDALLAFEANRLRNERTAAEEAFLKNPSEANQKRIDDAQSAYSRTANVLDRAGTESGRSLNARKMMLAEDYSLAEMSRQMSIAKGGDKLSAEESAKVKQLHEKIAATEKALSEYMSQAELRAKELEARALLAEAKRFAAEEKKAKPIKFAERKASIAKTKKRIDEILNKLASGTKAAAGIDPEKVTLTAQLATEYVKLGYQSFRLFADEVVAKVGENIRPYLRKAWDDAQAASDEDLLKRYKARKESDITRIKEKTAAGIFETARRKTPIGKDPRAVELKVEYEAAKKQFERERERVRRKHRTKTQKAIDAAREVLAAPRALKFSFDLPPIFRQAARFAVPDIFFNPKRLATFTAKGISAISKRQAERIDVRLRDHQMMPLAEAGGLSLPEVEEEMSSWVAQKIPGVSASARVYNTFMNLYRMSAFEGLLRGMPGPITLDDARTAARAVNILTGRGNAKGRVASAIDGLGAALSSPRLLLSNLQTLAGAPLYYGSWRVRRRVAKQYARFLSGYAALYGLVELVDAADGDDEIKVGWDPRSSDFGKIVIGDKRVDVLGGLSQITTLLGRVAAGETVSTKGKVVAIRGKKKPFKGKDALDLGKDFIRYKLSPAFSVGAEVLVGEQLDKDKRGKPLPITPESIAEGLFVPISMEDIYDDMVKFGVDETLAMRIIGLFGASVRDYSR